MPYSVALGAVGELAASHHGAFTRRQAAAIGTSSQALTRWKRRGVLTEPVAGVLVVRGSPPTWHQRVYVATASLDEHPVASGAASARLHRLDGFEDDTSVEVTVEHGRRLRLPGAAVRQTTHAIPPEDIIVIDGIRTTGLARTICDLAGRVDADRLERAIDDFQRRGASLLWLERTALRLQRRGRAGSRQVLEEVARRRTAGRVRDSWFEKLTELCLRSPRIPGLVRQHVVRDERGRFVARLDLAVPLVRLGIEAHSREQHFGPAPEAADQRRDNLLALQGWDVRYLGYADVTQTPRQVCTMVERLVERRAFDLGIDLPVCT
jgi:very-short-patch-repair endonuclease